MIARMLTPLIGTAVLLAAWQALVTLAGLPPFILPGPWRVGEALVGNAGLIAFHAGATLIEVVIGLVLGAILGTLTALGLVASPLARQIVRPTLVLTQALPVFALAPILTLWLGFGMLPKIAMTVLIVFFPVAAAFLDGLGRTPQAALDLAQVMGASRGRIMRHLRIPAALPHLATGLRLAAVYAPIGAVIGEWVGGARGLGALMIHANGRMKTDLVFAALLVLSVMTVIFARLVSAAISRIWRRYGV